MVKRKKEKFDLRTWLYIAVGLIVVAVALLLFWPSGSREQTNGSALAVYFVDVDQGDGIVIRCEDTALVIDGGEAEKASRVASLLKEKGISELDCYIATHPHSDHIGGAAELIRQFHAKTVMMTAFSELYTPTSAPYEKMIGAIEETGCSVLYAKGGDSYDFGPLHLEVFSPVGETGNYNSMSLVIRMTYQSVSFLFTGDAGTEVEEQLLSSGRDLSATVLKLGHHGGSDATGVAFLSAVSPRYAVISCGYHNDYGHPAAEVLARLEARGVTVFRTDQQGNVSLFSDGKTITSEVSAPARR